MPLPGDFTLCPGLLRQGQSGGDAGHGIHHHRRHWLCDPGLRCGHLRRGAGELGPCDLFVLPGGYQHTYTAASEDAVVWLVTNEPQLAFENLQAPAQGTAPTGVVHYPAAEIDRQIGIIDSVGRNEEEAGSALIFSSDTNEASRNALPTLTVAMNYLPPGITQRPHRHNSVAVSLVIKGENCFSTIDGKRKDWAPWCTTITPPVSIHSHSNHGDERAMFLIIKDGGLYYHGRTMGFEFVEQPE